MTLEEVNQLINVRRYLSEVINSSTIDNTTARYISGAMLLLDKKILTDLQSNEFKSLIGHKDIQRVVEEAAELNNIKPGLIKNKK